MHAGSFKYWGLLVFCQQYTEVSNLIFRFLIYFCLMTFYLIWMFSSIKTIDEYNKLVENELALLVYFSTNECSVCKVLKPKVGEILNTYFPKIKLFYVNLNESPEISAQNRIFAVPTILVIFDRHEYIRKSRNFGLNELKSEIERPYQLMFS